MEPTVNDPNKNFIFLLSISFDIRKMNKQSLEMKMSVSITSRRRTLIRRNEVANICNNS